MKRPSRITKQSKAMDRKFQDAKCRECTVVVTRMDFAKILGKFTKVKIQYESNSPKDKQKALREMSSPNSNARLKSNENGMVLIHRSAYKEHPVKEILSPKKQISQTKSPIIPNSKQKPINNNNNNNVLKENNRLKKSPILKDKIIKENVRRKASTDFKHYAIIFTNPKKSNHFNETKNKISLLDLLPSIDKNILPSNDWSIDYLPNTEEPKEDKVYDRIAAELEDLMYNEKSIIDPVVKSDDAENKDDFPSILDILNEKPSDNNLKKSDISNEVDLKSNLASSDVEAMLLDDPDVNKPVNNLIDDVEQLSSVVQTEEKPVVDNIEEPGSPSILDEALQKGIAEHLPDKLIGEPTHKDTEKENAPCVNKVDPMVTEEIKQTIEIDLKEPAREITHLVFKHTKDGNHYKTVTCPKTLKYNIELDGKPIELLGAPKFITCRDDLQVLLQIVNESELESFYVLQ